MCQELPNCVLFLPSGRNRERGIPLDQPQPHNGMLSGNRFYGGACSRAFFNLTLERVRILDNPQGCRVQLFCRTTESPVCAIRVSLVRIEPPVVRAIAWGSVNRQRCFQHMYDRGLDGGCARSHFEKPDGDAFYGGAHPRHFLCCTILRSIRMPSLVRKWMW